MSTPTKSFICLALSLVLLALAGPVGAQGFKWWQNGRFQKELGLTDEQVARLEGIFQTTSPTMRAQKNALERLEDTLSKVIADPASDEAAVLQASDRVEAARGELSRTRTLMLYRMRRVLSNEQNEKMKQLHEKGVDRDGRPRGGPSRRPPVHNHS
jgi:Spy/CpxP family protein refolding chaperone